MNAPYPQLVEVLRDRRRALGLARDQPLAPPSIIRVSRRPLPSPNCSAARVLLPSVNMTEEKWSVCP